MLANGQPTGPRTTLTSLPGTDIKPGDEVLGFGTAREVKPGRLAAGACYADITFALDGGTHEHRCWQGFNYHRIDPAE